MNQLLLSTRQRPGNRPHEGFLALTSLSSDMNRGAIFPTEPFDASRIVGRTTFEAGANAAQGDAPTKMAAMAAEEENFIELIVDANVKTKSENYEV